MPTLPREWLHFTTPQVLVGCAAVAVGLLILPHAAHAEPINTALETGEFEIFSTALKQSGLWDQVTSHAGVTMFVVSDKAMRDEGSAFLLDKVLLTRHNQERLVAVMSHHISFGAPLLPEAIRSGMNLRTSADGCLAINKHGTGLRIGPEAVVTDVKHVDSGVVYVIDRLLWQPWEDDESCPRAVAKVLDDS